MGLKPRAKPTAGYDESLAQRVRSVLGTRGDVVEKKMFGGLCFMVGGHMCCGIVGSELMLRVAPDDWEATLELPNARVMDFTGKPMRGMVYVRPDGIRTPATLQPWIRRALAFVETLPRR